MKILFSFLVGVGMATLLTGCGTVSHVTPVANQELKLQKYERVLVLDFADDVSGKVKSKDQEKKKAELALATRAFPDRIAVELSMKKAFREVTRSGSADDQTLVISGIITRYEEGSSVARLLVGMGAGSSYFDATVDFKDGMTTNLLGSQKVDKNSWGLGGGLAATQTPDTFMREAAKKLAEDIASLKLTGKLPEKKRPEPKK
jgi:hypothetical protein